MTEDKKQPNEPMENKEPENKNLSQNVEDTICSPEFPAGCVDVEQ